MSFPVAETGFDPQAAGDIYSNTVNRVIFDPLYKYDHLARPLKLVPNTAVALPEITPDGKTWTIRIKPGIYFTDDPAFKGKKRELTAHDYVYSWKRILDPRMRSNNFQVFDGRFVGAEAVMAKAKETGKLDYDAPIEGLQAIDRYTIRMKLNFPDTELLSNLTISAMRRGCARGRRGLRRRVDLDDGEPGRHRSLQAQGMAARPEDRARGQSGLPRGPLSRSRAIPPTRRSWRSSRASGSR